MDKKRTAIFLVLLLSVLFTVPAAAEARLDNETEAAQIMSLINEYRQEQGLYQYVYNPVLAATALKHGEYQASIEESTHYGEGGSRSSDRAREMGYGDGKYIFVSEMIYSGQYATPQAALTWWKNSPIHNGIMLSTDYHEIGVAVTRTDTHIYYTVNVGAVRGVTSPGVGSGGEVEVDVEATSVPVTVAPVDESGGIFHIVEEGQTASGIAEAYDVSIETLRLLNGLAENTALVAGQILLIQQPEDVSEEEVVVEAQIDAEDPIDAAQTATVEAATPTASSTTPPTEPAIVIMPATATPVLTQTQGSAAEEEGGRNWFGYFLVVGLMLALIAGAVYWYLRTQRDEPQGEGESDESRAHAHDSLQDDSPFHHFSRQKQFELLEEVAVEALRSYPLEVFKIEHLRYVLNAEFLVDARMDGGGEIEQFVVRVNAPRFNSGVEIASELDWLNALNEQTRMNVPQPVRKRNGDWVKIVDLPDIDEPRHCVVFKYIPGSTIEMEATPAHLEVMGALVGLLHRHGAEQFEKPLGFVRIHWDTEGLKGGNLDVSARQAYNALTEHEREIVNEAEKLVGMAMKKIGRREATFGLIHGDLHLKSILFHQRKPLILDFDTCGYGYYAYDLAVPIWNLFHRDDFSQLKAALLKGYRRVRPLSQEEESLLIHFVAGRLMSQILAWAGRREHTNLSAMADEAIKKEVDQLERLINLLES